MIRVTVLSNDSRLKHIIESFFKKYVSEFEILPFQMKKQYDIYFLEIHCQEDLQQYAKIKRNSETMIYIIGPQEFDLIQNSLHYQIQFYFTIHHLGEELHSHKEEILKLIQNHFKFYLYQNASMKIKMRLSDIFYIESIRHQIIIHSINGELHERKNLRDIIKELSSSGFVQVHKSFIINKRKIHSYNSKGIHLNNGEMVPVGRIYKDILSELMD